MAISKVFDFFPQEINEKITFETVILEKKTQYGDALTCLLFISSFFRMKKLIFNFILFK